jgi:hypothetical protein
MSTLPTKTAWADLPNAKYIDLVIDSLKKNPVSYSAAGDASRGAVWDASRGAVWDAARTAAWNAILALIAWDDCGYLLEENPEDAKILALLGHQAAVLLYPACVALQNTKELEIV